MIKLDHIRLQRGSKVLLENASAVFNTGQKIALVGTNGSGKSSLFQLLLRQLSADDGSLVIPDDWQIAHMAQEVEASTRPAVDYVIDGDLPLRDIEKAIASAEHDGRDGDLAELHQYMDNIDGYNAGVRAQQLLLGLGFAIGDLGKAANHFSGGWRIRLNLARALMGRSDMLLLDEPTNHLDLDAELWLEQWLQRYPGTLLLISHDRDFIDAVCDGVVHLERRQLFTYRGNYSAFERQRAERLAQQQAAFEKQQQRKAEIHHFVSRFRAKATKAKQAQSRLKELARMEDIAPAHVDSPFDFRFPEPDKFSDPLLNLSDATLGYAETAILRNVQLSIHPGSRIGLLGANGAGKSTLIKSLAGELPPIEGNLVGGENLALGYFTQHQMEALDLDASPLLHLQRLSPTASEQDIRNFLGSFNFRGDMALDPIAHFSGGEKARLALALIVWQKPNLLLLDEPTNHLDLEMCHALTVALQGFTGAVVVVSHDRHLLRNTVDEFLLIDSGRVSGFEGDLDDYSQWLIAQCKQDNTGSQSSGSGASKKQQRQRAADLRNKLKPLTSAIKKLESRIQEAEQVLEQIAHQLEDVSLYRDDNKQLLQQLLIDQGKTREDKEKLEEQWFELHEQLDNLQAEY